MQQCREGHDWHDIAEMDWPSVRVDVVEAAGRGEPDPLPVPELDLGVAASGQLTGAASSALPWERLRTLASSGCSMT